MNVSRVRVVVGGRVQGVWFRASTQEMAQAEGVHGWVRNLPDGDVEAVFEGGREAVERALAWCRRGGPPKARVDRCEETWEAPRGEGPFRVRYD